ncbi:MAG: thiamine pyrophosphate-requiring protein [Alphaproteobacteria bacterium]|nr:thiamine pyrophosphate-requiring protein [Alphaproteobacteria bacterium]
MDKSNVQIETVAEAYLAMLGERGVEYLFANAGTDFPPIIEALARCPALGVDTPKALAIPHENLAVAMAYGYTLVSGRPQAVMLHVNVGTANGLCGIINASRGRIPMLFTSGRTPINETGIHGSRSIFIHWPQEMFDQAGMVREHVKWDYELRNGDQLATVVDRALNIAVAEPQGPVYLTLPREVLAAPLSDGFERDRPQRRKPPVPPHPDADAIIRAAQLIAAAENPLIITTELGRNADAVALLSSLADRFSIPVVSYRPRYVNLASDHPMHAGGEPGPYLGQADVVVIIEADVPWIPSLEAPNDDATIIQIGIDPHYSRYPIRGFPCDLGITGEPSAAVRLLGEALEPERDAMKGAIESRRQAMAEVHARRDRENAESLANSKEQTPISPVWLAACVDAVKGDQAVVVNELGLASQYLTITEPGGYYATPGAGGLGWALGAALGIKLADPDKLVIAAVGDGAYMFGNPTPAHFVSRSLGLPVLFIVANNSTWGAVRRATREMYPEGHGVQADPMPLTDLTPSPDFEKVVEASGGYGEKVEDPAALPGALERAMHAVQVEGRQAVLNVICRGP